MALGIGLSIGVDTEAKIAPITLGALSLDDLSIAEDQVEGTKVGTITGATPGSTITLHAQSNANMFAKDGNDIEVGAAALDFETVSAPTITLRETLSGATNSPKDSVIVITVTDVAEGPTELIANGNFASAGPPPTRSATVGSAPIILAGQLIFDQTQSSEASAYWIALATIATGSVTINLSNPVANGSYTLRIGGTAVGVGGTAEQYEGDLIDEVFNVTTADGNYIVIEDQFSGNIFDSFSVMQ